MAEKPFVRFTESKPGSDSKEPVQVTQEVTENKEIDIPFKLQEAMGETDGIQITAPRYTTLRTGNLQVSYAAIGDDYYYQIELLAQPRMDPKDVLGNIIQACSTVIPETIQTYISEPPSDINWVVYTVIAKKAATLLGAAGFMEKKLVQKFLDMKLW